MNRDKAIRLADAPGLPAASMAFYDRYRERITGIESVEQRNRDKLSEVYQLLKRKCWEVGLFGNG